jgi:hypothetical protein
MFLNRAMDENSGREFDEQAFWASQALELLAKAALSRCHPALIAEPTEDGLHILIASGLVQGEARFTSVRAKTIFSRCERAFKPFDASEAMKIANARNAYLHSGVAAFTPLPAEAWWPKFWAMAIILVNALDRSAIDLVGSARVEIVEGYLAQNKRNVEARVEMLLERARQRASMLAAGSVSERVTKEMSAETTLLLTYGQLADCPACGDFGRIEGQEIIDSDVEYEQVSEDDFEVTVTHSVWAERFVCRKCGLFVDGQEFLRALNFPETIQAEGDLDDIDHSPEYGND